MFAQSIKTFFLTFLFFILFLFLLWPLSILEKVTRGWIPLYSFFTLGWLQATQWAYKVLGVKEEAPGCFVDKNDEVITWKHAVFCGMLATLFWPFGMAKFISASLFCEQPSKSTVRNADKYTWFNNQEASDRRQKARQARLKKFTLSSNAGETAYVPPLVPPVEQEEATSA